MPEIVVTYKNDKTLDLLKGLSKYLDFSLITPKKKKENIILNGVSIISSDEEIDISDLKKIFSKKDIDFKQLRTESWSRNL